MHAAIKPRHGCAFSCTLPLTQHCTAECPSHASRRLIGMIADYQELHVRLVQAEASRGANRGRFSFCSAPILSRCSFNVTRPHHVREVQDPCVQSDLKQLALKIVSLRRNTLRIFPVRDNARLFSTYFRRDRSHACHHPSRMPMINIRCAAVLTIQRNPLRWPRSHASSSRPCYLCL
jgi:hypothetical protein